MKIHFYIKILRLLTSSESIIFLNKISQSERLQILFKAYPPMWEQVCCSTVKLDNVGSNNNYRAMELFSGRCRLVTAHAVLCCVSKIGIIIETILTG